MVLPLELVSQAAAAESQAAAASATQVALPQSAAALWRQRRPHVLELVSKLMAQGVEALGEERDEARLRASACADGCADAQLQRDEARRERDEARRARNDLEHVQQEYEKAIKLLEGQGFTCAICLDPVIGDAKGDLTSGHCVNGSHANQAFHTSVESTNGACPLCKQTSAKTTTSHRAVLARVQTLQEKLDKANDIQFALRQQVLDLVRLWTRTSGTCPRSSLS